MTYKNINYKQINKSNVLFRTRNITILNKREEVNGRGEEFYLSIFYF